MANPTVSADVSTRENELTACLKRYAVSTRPVHPSLVCAFANGDTKLLEAYALQTFSLAVLRRGPARNAFVQAVIAKYLATQQAGGSVAPTPTVKS